MRSADLATALSQCQRADGRTDWVRWAIHPWRDTAGAIGGLIMFTEVITERQRVEQERAGIESKMVESLGVLAGGIAHAFSNLLTSILGNANLVRYDLPKDSPFHASLEQIEQTSLRAADLCRQMLAYSGRGRFQLQRVDRAYLTTTYLAPELPEGEYVFLEISDNGCGMTSEVKARILDPFYTTKFTGRRLGLATVLGIVRGHKGALKVYSEPGRGTSFKLILPVAPGAASSAAGAATARPLAWPRSHPRGGRRGVGAHRVRPTAREHRLHSDTRRGRARRRGEVRGQPGAFDLVLMDLTMPHLDGVQSFALMRRLQPDVQVILMSGFNEQDAIANFTGKGVAGFLPKPFELATLRERIRAALEAKS